jgi:hypothetical protein
MVTSSGMRCSSISARMKLNSTSAAAGNPTSISLKPILHSSSNSSFFCSMFIGTGRAWLPSRRSTLHQIGARSMDLSGQVRSGSSSGR